MTPKGAAVLPRPFCFFGAGVLPPFLLLWRGGFAAILSVFPPLSPSSCSPRPATFCELLPAPMVTLCELLPVPPAGKVYILPTFACAPFWQSWLFVNFLRHFAQCPATYCQLFADFRRRRRQLFVNFYPRPIGQSWHFVNFWRHFAHLRRAFCHLLSPFLPYFRFIANFNFTSAGL